MSIDASGDKFTKLKQDQHEIWKKTAGNLFCGPFHFASPFENQTTRNLQRQNETALAVVKLSNSPIAEFKENVHGYMINGYYKLHNFVVLFFWKIIGIYQN